MPSWAPLLGSTEPLNSNVCLAPNVTNCKLGSLPQFAYSQRIPRTDSFTRPLPIFRKQGTLGLQFAGLLPQKEGRRTPALGRTCLEILTAPCTVYRPSDGSRVCVLVERDEAAGRVHFANRCPLVPELEFHSPPDKS